MKGYNIKFKEEYTKVDVKLIPQGIENDVKDLFSISVGYIDLDKANEPRWLLEKNNQYKPTNRGDEILSPRKANNERSKEKRHTKSITRE